MIYSIDKRKTWRRFQTLGRDRFLSIFSPTESERLEVTSYLKQPGPLYLSVSDLVTVPMRFEKGSDAANLLIKNIDRLLDGLTEPVGSDGLSQLRAKIPVVAKLSDEALFLANVIGPSFFYKELRDLRELLNANEVWVAWPNQRGSLVVSANAEVDKAGKRCFDAWRRFIYEKEWVEDGSTTAVNVKLDNSKSPERLKLTPLQEYVLGRSTHFVAISAFADFAILSMHPGEGLPRMPAIGCAVAARGVIELSAHYLKGTGVWSDPGEGFELRRNSKDLIEVQYDNVLKGFKAKYYWDKEKPPDASDIRKNCEKALQEIWNCINLKPPQLYPESRFKDDGISFEPPNEERVWSDWRTSIDRQNLDSCIEIAAFGFEWLLDLWADKKQLADFLNMPKIAYQVATRVYCWNLESLITRVENYRNPKDPKFDIPLKAIADLLRAFCLAFNLAPLVAGAIARELHLHVEKLTEEAKLCVKRDDKLLEELPKFSDEYQKQKKIEDDKSLKCIEQELTRLSTSSDVFKNNMPDFNQLRPRLQDVLQSFAHPGWLIRTETAHFSGPSESGISCVRIEGGYRSGFFPDIDPLTMKHSGYPVAEQRLLNPFYMEFQDKVPPPVMEAMRKMPTGQADIETLPGSAFEIPLVAVTICTIALGHFLDEQESQSG